MNPGRVDSRLNGCRFGWEELVVVCIVMESGNEGVWSRRNGGGHCCWETCAKEDRLLEPFPMRNGTSCKLWFDTLELKSEQSEN